MRYTIHVPFRVGWCTFYYALIHECSVMGKQQAEHFLKSQSRRKMEKLVRRLALVNPSALEFQDEEIPFDLEVMARAIINILFPELVKEGK